MLRINSDLFIYLVVSISLAQAVLRKVTMLNRENTGGREKKKEGIRNETLVM